MSSEKMVLGRTYFQESLNSLVIPLRKSISIDGKNVDAVMTAGLRLDSTIVFESNAHAGSYNTLTLLRTDNYRQFFSSDIESLDAYLKPIANDLMKRIYQKLCRTGECQRQRSETGKDTYSFSINDNAYQSLVSAKYIPNYKLWVVGRTDLEHVDGIFVKEFGILFFAFIFLQFGFYTLLSRSLRTSKELEVIDLPSQSRPINSLPNRLYMRRNIGKWIEDESEQFRCCL